MTLMIYGEARRYSELAQQIYDERFPQVILSSTRPFENVVRFRAFRY
jgi:hypothetical protein